MGRQEKALIDSRFIFLALSFNVIGVGLYLRKALNNDVKPHLVTWFLWALGPYVAFAAQVSEGVGLVSLMTLMAGITPTVVFVVSVRRRDAHWSISPFDLLCGLFSVIGLTLWIILHVTGFAVALAIIADAFASAPTCRKSLSDPGSEEWVLYGCLSVSALIGLATIKNWTFTEFGFLGYLATLGISLTLIILVGNWRTSRARAI